MVDEAEELTMMPKKMRLRGTFLLKSPAQTRAMTATIYTQLWS